MGCRVTHEEMRRERMEITANLGYQVQPLIAQKAVIQELNYACRNMIRETEKSPSPSTSESPHSMSRYEDLYVTSPLCTYQPMMISPSTLRLSISSKLAPVTKLAPVKVLEPSDSKSMIGSQTSTKNITDYESSYGTQTLSSIYSSTTGKNNQSLKRGFVTYNLRSPASSPNQFSGLSPSLYSVSRSMYDSVQLNDD